MYFTCGPVFIVSVIVAGLTTASFGALPTLSERQMSSIQLFSPSLDQDVRTLNIFCDLYGDDACADIKEKAQSFIESVHHAFYVNKFVDPEISRSLCLEGQKDFCEFDEILNNYLLNDNSQNEYELLEENSNRDDNSDDDEYDESLKKRSLIFSPGGVDDHIYSRFSKRSRASSYRRAMENIRMLMARKYIYSQSFNYRRFCHLVGQMCG